MNRIQKLPALAPSLDDLRDPADLSRMETAVGGRDHALFGPLHYEPNYAYPLLIWLHGCGDTEKQLARIMPLVSMRNYVAVAPRGTLALDEGWRRAGFTWRQSDEGIFEAEQRVLDCLRIAAGRFRIAPSRIFLAGYGAGGSMALRIALNLPERFAGAASLGGPFPHGQCPLQRIDAVRSLPLLLATARDSRRYPPSQVANDLRLLHAGGLSLALRQYPCGDELTTTMLADLNRWLMECICQPADHR